MNNLKNGNFSDPFGLLAGDLSINGQNISNKVIIEGETYGSIRDVASAYGLHVFNVAVENAYSVVNSDFEMKIDVSVDSITKTKAKILNGHIFGKTAKIRYTMVIDTNNLMIAHAVVNVQDFVDAMTKIGKDTEITYDLGSIGGTWSNNISRVSPTNCNVKEVFVPQKYAYDYYVKNKDYGYIFQNAESASDVFVNMAGGALANKYNEYTIKSKRSFVVFQDLLEGTLISSLGITYSINTYISNKQGHVVVIDGGNVGVFEPGKY